jgi:hypothetical protein
MPASVKASRASANPKGLALTPIQTKDARGCGASQRQLRLHRMPNCCVCCFRARRQARTVRVCISPRAIARIHRGAPRGRTGGDDGEHAARSPTRAEARAQPTAPGVGGGSCALGTREALDKHWADAKREPTRMAAKTQPARCRLCLAYSLRQRSHGG